MYDLEFIDAATGETIGTADRERAVPAEGSTVTLEHAIFGPVAYGVVAPADHWYRSRTGRIAKADQYAGGPTKVYLERIEARS